METSEKYCIVTVTTESYSQWTMTMIFSFLRSNEWFVGDIIVISNDLTEETSEMFAVFNNLIIKKPSDRLIGKVANLSNQIPGFKNIASMFYSLELFNLKGYKKVLFLDSDMLVIQSVREVLDFDARFVACVESCWYSGMGRKVDTYESTGSWPDPAMFIKNPINSGFMVIDEHHLTYENYDDLIDMIEAGLWSNKKTFHADQLIINLFFKNRITLADARYNYRPTNAAGIRRRDQINFEDAKIIHYFRQYKPWNFKEVFELSRHEMVNLRAFKLWYTWYIDFLKFYHLKSKINILLNHEQIHS
jgi:lipopolysaccharide biosynthesis glycosyltransferase